MSLFKKSDEVSERKEEILAELKKLSTKLAEMEGKRTAAADELALARDYATLKKQVVDKQIELDRVVEKHEREKRDIEHMVGLEKKRQEFEMEATKREVTLQVREENLKAQQDRFEEQMAFMTTRMESELDRLNKLTSEMLERLPVVKVDRHIKETVGARSGNGNGKHDEDDDGA